MKILNDVLIWHIFSQEAKILKSSHADEHLLMSYQLKEGEHDPAIYEDMASLGKKAFEYRQKVKQLLQSLGAQ